MLWACLHFPDLPLHAVFDEDESAACAVVDGPRQRQHIAFANTQAQRSGIKTGQPLAAARAVCASLQAKTRDITAEQRLLQGLAAWAYRFSSHVSLSGGDALLIEIGASLRLFGGWPALERRLRRELAAIGQTPGLGIAPIAAAARVLAVHNQGCFTQQRTPMLSALGQVPIAQAGFTAATISLLYNVGLRSLRDVFALPRAELARRIGPAELAHLDRLRGDASEILVFYSPPEYFENRIELEARVEAWPPLLFPLRRLCAELALFLTARDGGVQRCDLVLDHEDHPSTRIGIELLTPQREAHTLYTLIRSRLERASLAHPISAIALAAKDLPELCPRHKDLFEPQREQGLEWPQLAERLRAHLGDAAVCGIAGAADHRPERAWRFDHEYGKAGNRKVTRCSPLPSAGEAAPQARVRVAHDESLHTRPRPFWLLPRALPLRATPQRILAGPERIESGWWDGGDVRRDYYVVQTRDGQRAWAYLIPGNVDGWMLHGWFA